MQFLIVRLFLKIPSANQIIKKIFNMFGIYYKDSPFRLFMRFQNAPSM